MLQYYQSLLVDRSILDGMLTFEKTERPQILINCCTPIPQFSGEIIAKFDQLDSNKTDKPRSFMASVPATRFFIQTKINISQSYLFSQIINPITPGGSLEPGSYFQLIWTSLWTRETIIDQFIIKGVHR